MVSLGERLYTLCRFVFIYTFFCFLRIGPTDLTEGTVTGVTSVPTVTDNLYTQGTISTDAVGVFFAPTTVESTANGELTFGS